jgi:hypothetical protein
VTKEIEHDYGADGGCVNCGFTERDALIFPWMSCYDVIEDHEAELAFETYAS